MAKSPRRFTFLYLTLALVLAGFAIIAAIDIQREQERMSREITLPMTDSADE